MIWTIVLFVITISLLVTIHEFGHFILAKLCGVKVECFSIGFGKKLIKHTTKKGTEFSISAIPLGGYVKMADTRVQTLSEDQTHTAFDKKPIYKRALIVSAGPMANFLLALIVYWIIFQIGVTVYPVKIEQTFANTPASSINIPQDAELKLIDGIKVESWKDVSKELLRKMGDNTITITYSYGENNQTETQNIDISKWEFDVEKSSPIMAFGFKPAPIEILPIISKVMSNSAAEKAQLEIGDRIISYNGIIYKDWELFTKVVKKGNKINLVINRNGVLLQRELTPSMIKQANGEIIGVAGIYPSNNTTVKQYGIVSALIKGSEQTIDTVKSIIRSFYQLITGTLSLKNLSGPITIAQGAAQMADYGLVPYLYFLAFISVSLGIVNLLPLPVLDGGHLLFLLIEKIKGSPLSEVKQEIFYRIGIFLLMAIMGVAIFNDFTRLSL
ncbi:RIP metalloprotease RseP [Orbaceae bacterium ac157xtp]